MLASHRRHSRAFTSPSLRRLFYLVRPIVASIHFLTKCTVLVAGNSSTSPHFALFHSKCVARGLVANVLKAAGMPVAHAFEDDRSVFPPSPPQTKIGKAGSSGHMHNRDGRHAPIEFRLMPFAQWF